jgi:hypothetical protein
VASRRQERWLCLSTHPRFDSPSHHLNSQRENTLTNPQPRCSHTNLTSPIWRIRPIPYEAVAVSSILLAAQGQRHGNPLQKRIATDRSIWSATPTPKFYASEMASSPPPPPIRSPAALAPSEKLAKGGRHRMHLHLQCISSHMGCRAAGTWRRLPTWWWRSAPSTARWLCLPAPAERDRPVCFPAAACVPPLF